MISDLRFIFTWWLAIFGIGLIFLPLTKRLFKSFFDQGYLFSKVLGILFSTYLVWLLTSLKILPFYKETIWLVIIFGIIVNLLIRNKKQTDKEPRIKTSVLVAEEIMFLLALIFWSYIRGLQPDIQGLEKFMDFGFVNSILRSKYFPPADMWFAGKSINYYYFGHYITAFFTKLTSIDPAVTYNLMLATLFSFTFSLTFSLTGNLVFLFLKEKIKEGLNNNLIKSFQRRIIGAGFIAALIISLGANLHPAFYNTKMGILKKPYCDGSLVYWYPNATRYIGYCPDVEDKTIHEFPAYSFIVSDLHGHVLDIIFVLTFLALSLILLSKIKEKPETSLIALFAKFTPMSLLLSVMYMTNQWDFPIYLMLLGFVLLLGYYLAFGFSLKTLQKSVSLGLAILLFSVPFFIPFQLGFEQIAKGIDIVHAHSLFYQLLVLWGIPWFFGLNFIIFLFGKIITPKNSFKKENIIKAFSKILGVDVEFKKSSKSAAGQTNILITDYFILILFLVSTILIIIPEIIYVKDIYISSYHRANTIFKLTYQSFIMFSISIGYVFIRIVSSLKNSVSKLFLRLLYVMLFLILMVYPFYSIKGYYGNLGFKNYKGLYGLQFLQKLYPDDYATVIWINKNILGQPNILEAVGDSYTDYERISMATGLPTIEGWLVHEWLWRGSFDEPGKRSSEVQTIYESKDVNQTKDLLQAYKVSYVIVGEMERQKYPNINEEKFSKIGKKIFESGKTALYEII